jgi:hypothetical protein
LAPEAFLALGYLFKHRGVVRLDGFQLCLPFLSNQNLLAHNQESAFSQERYSLYVLCIFLGHFVVLQKWFVFFQLDKSQTIRLGQINDIVLVDCQEAGVSDVQSVRLRKSLCVPVEFD